MLQLAQENSQNFLLIVLVGRCCRPSLSLYGLEINCRSQESGIAGVALLLILYPLSFACSEAQERTTKRQAEPKR